MDARDHRILKSASTKTRIADLTLRQFGQNRLKLEKVGGCLAQQPTVRTSTSKKGEALVTQLLSAGQRSGIRRETLRCNQLVQHQQTTSLDQRKDYWKRGFHKKTES